MMTVKFDIFFKSYKVNFIVETTHDRFIIWFQAPDHQIYNILTITFKQVLSGNLTFKYGGLRYKICGNLFSMIHRWYPEMKITNDKKKFVERFINQFNNLAHHFIETRRQIELELGPLPHAFSTFLKFNLPQTRDGLDIINKNALKMYNEKAQTNRWSNIRNLDELAYYISQILPEYKCSAVRKKYLDINGIKQRREVIICDLHSIAREISNKLDQLKY